MKLSGDAAFQCSAGPEEAMKQRDKEQLRTLRLPSGEAGRDVEIVGVK
jgi:hypothetical protein